MLHFAPPAAQPPDGSALCRCCEAQEAERHGDGGLLTDSDLGPVCLACIEVIDAAESALYHAGLQDCAPLGPGLASGELGG